MYIMDVHVHVSTGAVIYLEGGGTVISHPKRNKVHNANVLKYQKPKNISIWFPPSPEEPAIGDPVTVLIPAWRWAWERWLGLKG